MSTPVTKDLLDVHLDSFKQQMEALASRIDERDQHYARLQEERDKCTVERDRAFDAKVAHIEALVGQSIAASDRAAVSAERAASLKSTLWVTSATIVLSILGIVIAAYFATQQSNLSVVQTTIAAFQAGQQVSSSALPPTGHAH